MATNIMKQYCAIYMVKAKHLFYVAKYNFQTENKI